MNFFAHQDQARRHTRWLVALFIAAVIFIIAITNLAVAVCLWMMGGDLQGTDIATTLLNDARAPLAYYFTWKNFGAITLMVSGAICLAIGYKWLQLRGGGKRVAESLGGTLISSNTENPDHRRLLNVVEEMALASNMPVPSVYLLKNQKGINAFAAGYGPADAVIGITQGAVEQFDREQLQGVVAHEFSHILNGDMRLNLQMMALLNGIIFISVAGQLLIRSGGNTFGFASRRSADFRLVALGMVIFVLGSVGAFFAAMIKAAVSREREFLADAAAVQFTRNPRGIGEALKIIAGYEGGSRVFTASALEANHFFIADGLGPLLDFSTHPPLAERISRIDPQWDGQPVTRKMIVQPRAEPAAAMHDRQRARDAAVAAVAATTFLTEREQAPQVPTIAVPDGLRHQVQEPFGATAFVYALLLSTDEEVRAMQMRYIDRAKVTGLSFQVLNTYGDLERLDASHRLPLLEKSMPALRMLSPLQYKLFKRVLLLLIRADRHFAMFEWCLLELVRHYLAADFENPRPLPPRYRRVSEVTEEFRIVLSMLAHYGHDEDQRTELYAAFHRGANTAGLYNLELMPRRHCQFDDFVTAVAKLARCYPLLKPRILKALADCARYDGKILPGEREMIAAIAAIMDCPQPDLGGLSF